MLRGCTTHTHNYLTHKKQHKMGRSIKMRYIIRKSANQQFLSEWRIKEHGKPTAENLSRWRDAFNESLRPGGCNEHIGLNGWIQCGLEIYNQFTYQTVCSYNSPMFEVIN